MCCSQKGQGKQIPHPVKNRTGFGMTYFHFFRTLFSRAATDAESTRLSRTPKTEAACLDPVEPLCYEQGRLSVPCTLSRLTPGVVGAQHCCARFGNHVDYRRFFQTVAADQSPCPTTSRRKPPTNF